MAYKKGENKSIDSSKFKAVKAKDTGTSPSTSLMTGSSVWTNTLHYIWKNLMHKTRRKAASSRKRKSSTSSMCV